MSVTEQTTMTTTTTTMPLRPRVYDFHTTAYPAALNTRELPPRNAPTTTTAEETKATTVSASSAADAAAPVKSLTTSQMVAVMRELGWQLQRTRGTDAHERHTQSSCRMLQGKLLPAHIRHDERTTYRLDYCPGNALRPLHDTGSRCGTTTTTTDATADHDNTMTTAAATMTPQQRSDVAASRRCPYLTLPRSTTAAAPYAGMTVYRRSYMPDSDATSYRSVRHTVPRHVLGLSFAYSAYGVDDARRRVPYDNALAQLSTTLHSNRGGGDGDYTTATTGGGRGLGEQAVSTRAARRVHDTLEALRAQRRAEAAARAAQRARARNNDDDGEAMRLQSSAAAASPDNAKATIDTTRRLPYIALPRDAFVPHKIYDV